MGLVPPVADAKAWCPHITGLAPAGPQRYAMRGSPPPDLIQARGTHLRVARLLYVGCFIIANVLACAAVDLARAHIQDKASTVVRKPALIALLIVLEYLHL